MPLHNKFLILLLSALLSLPLISHAEEQLVFGRVIDAATGKPLVQTQLQTTDAITSSDTTGSFEMLSAAGYLMVRAPGYRAKTVLIDPPQRIALEPFQPKALYLSYWAASSRAKRQEILKLLEITNMNALVIDIKSVRGDIAYRSRIPLAAAIDAQKARTLKDLPTFLQLLKKRGTYVIARIAVFKDDRLAKGRRDLALHTLDGNLWLDRENLSWCDPFNKQVWDYNISIAEEVAALGVDEIQFDYIRFPAKTDLIFSEKVTGENRVTAISSFLAQAKQRLAKYNLFTSANIFGYICWKHQDHKIGQRIVDLAEHVDYLSPMLYPSGFPHGVPGYANPVENPYQVIAETLQQAQKLSGLQPERFRPWLQAFRDYAFDRRRFSATEVHAQINASDANGSHGWMLWNPRAKYHLIDLQQRVTIGKLNLHDISPKVNNPAMLSRIGQIIEDPYL